MIDHENSGDSFPGGFDGTIPDADPGDFGRPFEPMETPDGTLMDAPGTATRHTSIQPGAATYEIIEEIGRGGMAVVYLAKDTSLNREVALKRLLPQYTGSEKAVRRLMVEARATAKLHHKHLVHVYGVGEDAQGPYIAMEYVHGPEGVPLTLHEKIKRGGTLAEQEATNLVARLCAAVHVAHEEGIIHRDIKPGNVLLDRNGEPKLVDFGIAHAAADTTGDGALELTQDGAVLGSLGFMPPEQRVNAAQVDARSDVYGLGGVLYFCLTGKNMLEFREKLVPPSLQRVLGKAIDPDPEQRYESARDFATALRDGAGSPTTGIPVKLQVLQNVCPACEMENDRAVKFCGQCGASLTRQCPDCGRENPVQLKYCGRCGTGPAGFVQWKEGAERARELHGEKRWSIIVAEYRKLPPDARLNGKKGREIRASMEGFYEEAKQAIERLEGLEERIRVTESEKNWVELEKALQEYTQLNPHDEAAPLRLEEIRIRIDEENWRRADLQARKAMQSAAFEEAVSSYALYLTLHPEGKHAGVARQKLTHAQTELIEARKNEITALLSQTRLVDARDLAVRTMEKYPEDPWFANTISQCDAQLAKAREVMGRAIVYRSKGWFTTARREFEEAGQMGGMSLVEQDLVALENILQRRRKRWVAVVVSAVSLWLLAGLIVRLHNWSPTQEAKKHARQGRYSLAIRTQQERIAAAWLFISPPRIPPEWEVGQAREQYNEALRTSPDAGLLTTHNGEMWRRVQEWVRTAEQKTGAEDWRAAVSAYQTARVILPAAITEAQNRAVLDQSVQRITATTPPVPLTPPSPARPAEQQPQARPALDPAPSPRLSTPGRLNDPMATRTEPTPQSRPSPPRSPESSPTVASRTPAPVAPPPPERQPVASAPSPASPRPEPTRKPREPSSTVAARVPDPVTPAPQRPSRVPADPPPAPKDPLRAAPASTPAVVARREPAPAPVQPQAPAPRPTPEPAKNWISPSTGMDFVWIASLNIWVGKYEVTNEEYQKKEPRHAPSNYGPIALNGRRQPVVEVSFQDARTFARWMTLKDADVLGGARYRLPTSDEFTVYAQCGDRRLFPWGNQWPPPSGGAGNYADETLAQALARLPFLRGYRDGHAVTAPVEQSGANDWGLYGVSGNVWEVCATDASGETFAAWRGGSWRSYQRESLQVMSSSDFAMSPRGVRQQGDRALQRDRYRGFRLVLTVP